MIYEAQQKYQNLHQLFPGTGFVCMGILFHLSPGTASTRFGKVMAFDPEFIWKPDDIKPCCSHCFDDRQLGYRGIQMENIGTKNPAAKLFYGFQSGPIRHILFRHHSKQGRGVPWPGLIYE